MSLPGQHPKMPADLDFEASAPLPIDRSQENGRNPLSGLGSPTEFHPCTTVGVVSRRNEIRIHPFQGFFPYSVLPARRSHIPPTGPIPSVTLRPQVLSTSRRFAPHPACRAYFIPVPLLGFPLQGFSPATVPYALSSAGSLGVLASPRGSARPFRVSRTLHQAHR